MLEFSSLLADEHLDPKSVLIIRHTSRDPRMKRVLSWIAADRPDLFKAWQQVQWPPAEKAMPRAGWVAAFVGQEPGRATSPGSPASPAGARSTTRAISSSRATQNSSHSA